MDEHLVRTRRLAEADPLDTSAVVRCAIACELAGLVAEAWDHLSRSRAQGCAEVELVRATQACLARARPAETVDALVNADRRRRRTLLKALAKCGETVPAIVLGCDPRVGPEAREDANLALRRLVSGDRPGWPDAWFLSTVVDERPNAWALRHASVRWNSDALRLVRHATSWQLAELVPWLAALAARVVSAEVRAAAGQGFLELTGRRTPPLDARDMTRRWRS